MSDKYILKGHEAIECGDLFEWGQWVETANRHVAKDKIGEVKISTIFRGLDYSFGSGPPLLFETMVFGGELDGEQERYSTWEEAEKGHQRMKERIQTLNK